MRDYAVTEVGLPAFVRELQAELAGAPVLLVSTQDARTGRWGMARLWRAWMRETAIWMAGRGARMPLVITGEGEFCGEREFTAEDAHELFTARWLGVDEQGLRLSWSRTGRDGMRPATRAERYHALRAHEAWASDRGIILPHPRESEYRELQEAEHAC